MYENPLTATIPGTETKVTPEIAAPIVAKATTYQGDLRLPEKKPALSALRPLIYEIRNNTAK